MCTMTVCNDCGRPIKTNRDSSDEDAQSRCGSCTKLVENHCSIRVSPLERDDLELVLAWRSNPEIYRHFRLQNNPLEWHEHVTWFESRSPNRHDFMIHYDERRVGVVSIDSDDEVGIYLGDFSAHGHGIATASLGWLCNRFEDRTPLFAEIHEENAASKRLFNRCGFQQRDTDGEWLQYIYDP